MCLKISNSLEATSADTHNHRLRSGQFQISRLTERERERERERTREKERERERKREKERERERKKERKTQEVKDSHTINLEKVRESEREIS